MANSFSQYEIRTANELISRHMGVHYSPQRLPELEKILIKAMNTLGIENANALIKSIKGAVDSRLEQFLIENLTVGESYFFRDTNIFDSLENIILTHICNSSKNKDTGQVVIWSAACSTGEEPYSIAAVASHFNQLRKTIRIIGTDINSSRLAHARAGRYRPWSFRKNLPQQYSFFFKKLDNGQYQVHPKLMEMVEFIQLNLLDEYYPSPLDKKNSVDIIFCRNIFIYFPYTAQIKVLEHLIKLLRPGGLLFLSSGEMAGIQHPNLTLESFKGFKGLRKINEADTEAVSQIGSPSSFVISENISSAASVTTKSESSIRSMDEESVGNRPEKNKRPAKRDSADDSGSEGLFLQAMGYFESGNKEESITLLRKTLYVDSNFVMAHILLGTLLDDDIGQRHLRRALKILEEKDGGDAVPHADAEVATVIDGIKDLLSRSRTN